MTHIHPVPSLRMLAALPPVFHIYICPRIANNKKTYLFRNAALIIICDYFIALHCIWRQRILIPECLPTIRDVNTDLQQAISGKRCFFFFTEYV
jgi:hypothetical protein